MAPCRGGPRAARAKARAGRNVDWGAGGGRRRQSVLGGGATGHSIKPDHRPQVGRRGLRCGAMLALVKRHAEPGLWLEDVPEPDARHQRRPDPRAPHGHLRHRPAHPKWDAWAQRTIPVPMVIGHEFVGEIVAVGSNVNDFHARRRRQRRGPRRLRPLPQLHGRPPPPVRAHQRRRRQPARRVRRVLIALPMTNVWHHADGIDRRRRRDLRPVRQRRPHRARSSRCSARTC